MKKSKREKTRKGRRQARQDAAKQQKRPSIQEMDFAEFVAGTPEEIRGEVEETLTNLLTYLHEPTTTDEIVAAVSSQENIPVAIGQVALQSMDTIDPEHSITDATRVLVGYLMVKEIVEICNAAGITEFGDEETEAIYENAVRNYIIGLIKSQPEGPARDQEALRIQQEVEPLMRAQAEARARAGGPDGEPPVEEGEPPVEDEEELPPRRGGLSQ